MMNNPHARGCFPPITDDEVAQVLALAAEVHGDIRSDVIRQLCLVGLPRIVARMRESERLGDDAVYNDKFDDGGKPEQAEEYFAHRDRCRGEEP